MADTFQRKPLVFCSFSVLSKDIFSPPLHQSVYLVVVLPSSDLRISEAAFFSTTAMAKHGQSRIRHRFPFKELSSVYLYSLCLK